MPNNDNLSAEQADASLQKILDACHKSPASSSVTELADRGKSRSFLLTMIRIPAVLILLLLICLPLVFIKPDLNVTEQMGDDSLTIDLAVNSLWPVQEVTASLNGSPLTLTETDSGYRAVVPENGLVTLTATTIFHATKEVSHTYTTIPVKLPSLEDYTIEGKVLTLILQPGTHKIDYDGIVMMDESGEYPPTTITPGIRAVEFMLTGKDITISIPDEKGNVFQVYLSPVTSK